MTFDPSRCLSRFFRIQQFRKDAGLDCLVAICGSDGRFHRGSDMMRRYLLIGESGRDLALGTTEVFDEVVIAFGRDKTIAFCPQTEVPKFAKLTAMWPDFEIVIGPGVPEDDEYDNAKIRAFVAMMDNITGTLGILGDDLEKWPLVQAFALDDWPGAGRGFLSSILPIKRMDALLEIVYSQMDLHAQESMMEGVKKFEEVWSNAVNFWDFQLLEEYYEYGLLQDHDVEDGFPERVQYAAEPRRRVEPKGTHSTYVAVDPNTQVVVARAFPRLALEKNSDAKTEEVSTITALQTLVQGFDLDPFDDNVEDLLKERWKGADLLKVCIDCYDAVGLRIPPTATGLVDSMGVLKMKSGTIIVTVFVTLKNVCWGDTFLANKAAPRAPLYIWPLTTHFASPFRPAVPFTSVEPEADGHDSAMRWEGFLAPGNLKPDFNPRSPGFRFQLFKGPAVRVPVEDLRYCDEGENGLWIEVPLNGERTHVQITLQDLRGWPATLRLSEPPKPKESVRSLWHQMHESIVFSDLHADMMPPKSRRAGFDESSTTFTTLWVTAPAGARGAKELCQSLAKNLKLGAVESLRDLLFPEPMSREVSLLSTAAPMGVVCNDLAVPIPPPLKAFVICDLRVPVLWSPTKYRWHRWALHCVDSGFCDLCVLPPHVHGATSVEEWEGLETLECLAEIVKARNPAVTIIRPYMVNPSFVQEAMAKADDDRTIRRLKSRPGFLDEYESPGKLRCIYFEAKECYDEEILLVELSRLFCTVQGLCSIEIKVSGFRGEYSGTITPGGMLDEAGPWNGIAFWLYDGALNAEDIAREALKKCVKVLKPATVEEVSDEEMKRLLEQRNLPADWWFDGTAYVHALGERKMKHPIWDEVYKEAVQSHKDACIKKNYELEQIRAQKGIKFMPSSGM
eukprot:GEMP01017052.1.p1 GENE.GEMP01017052.1~~GEMP01017052.1.p1  ORF type:complete len:904 (+),score=194.68 GEMP01017052.1:109-2820(+)